MKEKLYGLFALVVTGVVFGLVPATSDACCGRPQPSITSVTTSPDMLWPPNHKMVEVIVEIEAVNTSSWSITNVDVQNIGKGEGDPGNDPDFEIVTGPVAPNVASSILLRAERSGKKGARVYVLTVTASNAWGSATQTVGVTVPHDMRGKKDN